MAAAQAGVILFLTLVVYVSAATLPVHVTSSAQVSDRMTSQELHLDDLSIPPEVITEALFSQVDLMQDQLEQCEEMVRNSLKGDTSAESVDLDDLITTNNNNDNTTNNNSSSQSHDSSQDIAQLAVNNFSKDKSSNAVNDDDDDDEEDDEAYDYPDDSADGDDDDDDDDGDYDEDDMEEVNYDNDDDSDDENEDDYYSDDADDGDDDDNQHDYHGNNKDDDSNGNEADTDEGEEPPPNPYDQGGIVQLDSTNPTAQEREKAAVETSVTRYHSSSAPGFPEGASEIREINLNTVTPVQDSGETSGEVDDFGIVSQEDKKIPERRPKRSIPLEHTARLLSHGQRLRRPSGDRPDELSATLGKGKLQTQNAAAGRVHIKEASKVDTEQITFEDLLPVRPVTLLPRDDSRLRQEHRREEEQSDALSAETKRQPERPTLESVMALAAQLLPSMKLSQGQESGDFVLKQGRSVDSVIHMLERLASSARLLHPQSISNSNAQGTASSFQGHRRKRSVEENQNPERYVPLIGQLVDRFKYLKHSLAVCQALLPPGYTLDDL